MPKLLTKPREYTIERLQELRREADLAGDTATRDALGDRIREMGGTVASSDIPENESKLGRLARLRQDALDVKDFTTAGLLVVRIAEEEVGVPTDFVAEDEVLQAQQKLLEAIGTDKSTEIVADLTYQYKQAIKHDIWGEYEGSDTDKAIDAESHTPHEGRDLVSDTPVADMLAGDEKIVISGGSDISREPLSMPPDAPESDEQRSEGDIAFTPVNNGTASVNAKALIAKNKYTLSEIPARFGGKVDMTDVKHYAKLLTAV